jgi:hypothetical protein
VTCRRRKSCARLDVGDEEKRIAVNIAKLPALVSKA